MNNKINLMMTDEIAGRIRPLHGVNCAPYLKASGADQPYIKSIFDFCKIPYSRLHDVCGTYGGTYFVDVPNIFRDFDADENDPSNYEFHYTDEYITALINSNAKVVYRLGVTIEWGTKQYTSNPPSDFAKWARICEHIIKHYNFGWADGFNYNIEYWEIWNEPENPPMWTGTREQFYSLYEIASKHLKTAFPSLKIGGYGSCGFYSVFRENTDDFYKSFITFFEDFLSMCREKSCPLDFYTWHIYTLDLSEIEKSQKYARETLDRYGFDKTEVHLNEWNYGGEGKGFAEMETPEGAAFCAGALITMQECGVDLAQYYCLNPNSRYNGFVNLRTFEFTSTVYVFAAFGKLFAASNELVINRDGSGPKVLGAANDEVKLMLVSNYDEPEHDLHLDLGAYRGKSVYVYRLDNENGFVSYLHEEAADSVDFKLETNSVFYVIVADKKDGLPAEYVI